MKEASKKTAQILGFKGEPFFELSLEAGAVTFSTLSNKINTSVSLTGPELRRLNNAMRYFSAASFKGVAPVPAPVRIVRADFGFEFIFAGLVLAINSGSDPSANRGWLHCHFQARWENLGQFIDLLNEAAIDFEEAGKNNRQAPLFGLDLCQSSQRPAAAAG